MKYFVLVVLCAALVVNAQIRVKFAASYHQYATSSARNITYMAQLQAKQMFDTLIRNHSPDKTSLAVLNQQINQTIYIDWWVEGDSGDNVSAIANVDKFCNDSQVDFIFGPPASEIANSMWSYFENNPKCDNIIGVASNGLPKSWYENSTNTFSIPPLPYNRYDPLLPLLKKYGISQVGVINIDHVFYTPLCDGVDSAKETLYGFKVKSRNKIISDAGIEVLSDNTKTKLLEAVDEFYSQITKDNNRTVAALMFCGPPIFGKAVLEHIAQQQYDFALVAMQPVEKVYRDLPSQMTDFVFFLDDFIPQVELGQDEWFNNCTNFVKVFKDTFANDTTKFTYSPEPIPQVYRILYSYLVAVKALENTKSITPGDLLFTMSRTDIKMILGRLFYDSFHRPGLQSIVTQYRGPGLENITVVGPPGIASATEFLPAPQWAERTYNPEITSVEWAFIGISLGFIGVSLIAGIAIIINRNHEIIHAGAVIFMLGILLGSIFVYISVILYRTHSLDIVTCALRVWFLGIGFFIMFGCLFAKSFRVWRLWKANLSKQANVITDLQLVAIVGGLTGMEVILLILYTTLGNLDIKLDLDQTIYKFKPGLSEEHCINNFAGTVLLGIMTCYGFLLMAFGLFLSWTTRKVPFLAFNESKIILFSMYNVSFFALLALIIILNEGSMTYQVQFILRTICLLLAAFVTVVISIGNKFWLVFHGKGVKSKTRSINKTNLASKNSTSTSTSDIIAGLPDQIARSDYDVLQQELDDARRQIQNLSSKIDELAFTND